MTFNAWFSSLSATLKILVILGIVALAFGVGSSFVASSIRIWKFLAGRLGRRDKQGNKRNAG